MPVLPLTLDVTLKGYKKETLLLRWEGNSLAVTDFFFNYWKTIEILRFFFFLLGGWFNFGFFKLLKIIKILKSFFKLTLLNSWFNFWQRCVYVVSLSCFGLNEKHCKCEEIWIHLQVNGATTMAIPAVSLKAAIQAQPGDIRLLVARPKEEKEKEVIFNVIRT